MFNKIDGFIIAYDLTKYLILPRPEKYDTVFNKIRYPIALKSSGPYVDSFNYAKIQNWFRWWFDSSQTLPMHNVVMIIKLAFNKNHNEYYCKIFLEKCLYQLAKK